MDSSLTTRWNADRTALALAVLHGRREPVDAAFGQHGGRWDLRGLALPETKKRPVSQSGNMLLYEIENFTTVEGAAWRDLDLSESSLPELRLHDVEMDNCMFVRAHLPGLRMWHTRVQRCDFTRADLNDSMLGDWSDGRGDSFSDCVFDRTNLKDFSSGAGDFLRCKFLNVRITEQRFLSTFFRDCVFTGKLREVIFDGRELRMFGKPGRNDMRGCDFTGAELEDVQFDAIDVSFVKFPTDPDLIVVPNLGSVVGAARKWVESDAAASWPDHLRKAVAEDFAQSESDAQGLSEEASGFFNLRDWRLPEEPRLEELGRAAMQAGIAAARK